MVLLVCLEVKAPKGVQSENQKAFELKIKRKSGFYFIVKSIDDVKESLSFVRKEVCDRIRDQKLS